MSKCLIVLGMHRSATSLVAKALHDQNNVHWPSSAFVHRSQPHGHWECRPIVELNDRILQAAGGAWFTPPPVSEIRALANQFNSDIARTLQKVKGDRPIWGWKDPRTVLTFELFAPHLAGEDLHFIVCFRDPRRIAASLQRRNGGDRAAWEKLAREYNERIFEILENYPSGCEKVIGQADMDSHSAAP